MLKKDKVSIYNKTIGHKDKYGAWISGGLTLRKSVYCDLQAYSKERFKEDYGKDIEVTARVFIKVDKDIAIGTILVFDEDKYEVKDIVNKREVMCVGI